MSISILSEKHGEPSTKSGAEQFATTPNPQHPANLLDPRHQILVVVPVAVSLPAGVSRPCSS